MKNYTLNANNELELSQGAKERIAAALQNVSPLEQHYAEIAEDVQDAVIRNPLMAEEEVRAYAKRRSEIYRKIIADNPPAAADPLPGLAEMFGR